MNREQIEAQHQKRLKQSARIQQQQKEKEMIAEWLKHNKPKKIDLKEVHEGITGSKMSIKL